MRAVPPSRPRDASHPASWWVRGLAVLLLLLLSAPPGWTHAALASAEPVDGAVLATAPSQFSLSFSEPVSPLVLALVRPDGARTELRGVTVRGPELEVPAPPGLADGTHVLAWRVVSEDGHPIGGSVIFSIGAPGVMPPAPEAVDWSVRAGLWIGKVLLYCGLFLGVGGFFAERWLNDGPARSSRPLAAFVLLGAGGAGLSLGFQGLDALGAPLGRLADGAVWAAGLQTSFGLTVVSAAVAFVLALCCRVLPRSEARGLATFALLLAGASLSASGHAGAASPEWLTRPAVFVHAAAIALWAGGLLPLAQALRAGGSESSSALRRFSRAIPFAVAALIAAGTVLAIVQVETLAALLATAYGRVLLVKLALLLPLFGLALWNRWRLTAATLRGEAAAARHLVRSIRMETAIVLLVFAVAACWRFTPPPRALAAAEVAEVQLRTGEASAEIVFSPGRAGRSSAAITVATPDYRPMAAKQVTLVMGSRSAGIEPFRRPASAPGDGKWHVADLSLPVPGIWQVRVDVLVSDFELLRLPGTVVIRP